MLVELQEDVLRELFGGRSILKDVETDAEDHRLVPADQGLEVVGFDYGGECGPHPSRDIYEKDGEAGCRAEGLFLFGPDARVGAHA